MNTAKSRLNSWNTQSGPQDREALCHAAGGRDRGDRELEASDRGDRERLRSRRCPSPLVQVLQGGGDAAGMAAEPDGSVSLPDVPEV